MTVRILAASTPGETRVVAERDGAVLDYVLWRPGAPDGVGDLHRGRLIARMPAMAGAFVALADGDGFLPDSEGAKGLAEGTVLGVRVTRAAQGGKGPRLTARLQPGDQGLIGIGAPARLRRGPGGVERLAALYPDAPVLVDDTALLASLRSVLATRVAFAPQVMDEAIETVLAGLEEPVVELPLGHRLRIHPTPALVAIDVDAGGAVAERRGKAEQHQAINRAVLPALAEQIRLRNLSGAILVDLAGLPMRRRSGFGDALSAALAADPLHPRLLGFTALGLAEIVRPRVHPPLHELLRGPHAAGLAALREAAARTVGAPGYAPILHAAPNVVRALQDDPVAMDDFTRRVGRAVSLRADPTLALLGWRLS